MLEHNFKWKNNGRTKVMIGCGTRPEIIRLAAVIKRCREYFDTCVVYYNQNWDRNLSTVFWEDFELKNNVGEFGPDILPKIRIIVTKNLFLQNAQTSKEQTISLCCFGSPTHLPYIGIDSSFLNGIKPIHKFCDGHFVEPIQKTLFLPEHL